MRDRPPGPKGLPVVGNGLRYARDPFGFLDACGRAYGDAFALRFGPQSLSVVTDPEAIRRVLTVDDDRFRKVRFQERALDRLLGDGLLLSEGDRWREMRTLASPAFRPGRVAALGELMTDLTRAMLADWEPGDTVDVASEMARLTLGIIAEAMFGAALADDQVDAVEDALLPVGRQFEPDPRRVLVPPWLPVPLNRRYDDAVETLDRVVSDVVRRRERGTEQPPGGSEDPSTDGGGDLLSILLAARRAGRIDDDQLRDELVTTLLAGHDTTALALTYAWHLLAENPDAEAALHAEVDAVLDGRTPTTGDLDDLAYTERVVLESMRRYPPVYAVFRRPVVDVKLAGYRVPEGTPVMLPQWLVHRDPRWYDDPDAFDPDRWAEDRAGGRPTFAYFPFGAGPRACIGRGFAMTEARLVLATVARRYRLESAVDGPLALRASITMHPDGPVEMTVRER